MEDSITLRSLQERLDRIEALTLLGAKEALNVHEAALFLGLSVSRLRHLTAERKVPHYKHDGKNYYKKSELEAQRLCRRIASDEEVRQQASAYVSTHKRH